MKNKPMVTALLLLLTLVVGTYRVKGEKNDSSDDSPVRVDKAIARNGQRMIADGKQTFRFDTFGDQAFWGDTLKLHRAIEGTKLGGVGPGVSPNTALAVGLKVDLDALPSSLVRALKKGQVDLNDPATTLALLKLNAVVGLTGFFKPEGNLRSLGIQCALCHSTVDDSLAPGIGHRLDGWAESRFKRGRDRSSGAESPALCRPPGR